MLWTRPAKSDLPPEVQAARNALIQDENGKDAVYHANVSGFAYADWSTIIPPPEINKNSTLPPDLISWNWSAPGKSKLYLAEKDTENINGTQSIDATLDLESSSELSYSIKFRGAHILSDGIMVFSSDSTSNFYGYEALPHFMPAERYFNGTKTIVLDQLDRKIKSDERSLEYGTLDLVPDNDVKRCDWFAWVQLMPVKESEERLRLIEQEARLSTGALPFTAIPPVVHSAVVYSPSCNIALQWKDAQGQVMKTFFGSARSVASFAALNAFIQVTLLIHQLGQTSTPSQMSKVSFWTIAIMAVMDGYLSIIYLSVGMLTESLFLPFVTAAFITFVLVSIFGMRLLLVVWQTQEPERRAARAPPVPPRPQPAADGTLPAPATAALPTPTPAPVQEESTSIGSLYARFYFLVFVLFLVSLHIMFSFPPTLRRYVLNTLMFGLYSFWVPQIYRNAIRGTRKAFGWWFVIGMSVGRLCIPGLYTYILPGNLVFLGEERGVWGFVLIAWMQLQLLALASQQLLGPRWFIPGKYLPPVYNYHPILPPTDEETNQRPDCAICMAPVEISHSAATSVLSRQGYMVPPCGHVFHSGCLEEWMRVRLQCPVCRCGLPPC
ncbi:hypothetical protein YB2330_005474 [Saitoella coloradoensis]